MKMRWYETTEVSQMLQKEVAEQSIKASHELQVTQNKDQIIEGFGGCFNELGWIALNHLSEEDKEKVITDLFDSEEGASFNFCRMPIGASDYAERWYSHNETPGDYAMAHFSIERDHLYLIPYIKAAKKHVPDLKLFASPWSPPTWMKQPPVYNYGRLVMEEENLKAYCTYFIKFLEAYQAEGIPIKQLHFQNETFADQKFPSCLWSGEQIRTFVGGYLGPALKEAKTDTELWIGTLNGPEQMKFMPTGEIVIDLFDDYVDHILFDENVRKYIKGIGYQWAGREAIQRTRESYPEIGLMQTENECGDGKNTWTYARYVFNLMRHYLRNGVSSYTYWNMVLEPGGVSTWGWHQNALITVDPVLKKAIYNPEYYVMKHFSAFVKEGAYRLEVTGPWSGSAVAFENPDGAIVVVAANNVCYDRDMMLAVKGEQLSLSLKGHSFNTFVLEG